MYLDLDSFKHINDSHGPSVGDQVLQSVAKRLQACVRHSDTVTVSRQEGDEFVVLLPEVEGVNDAALIAQKFIDGMSLPHLVGGRRVQVALSIGISLFPNDGQDVESMFRHADTALHHAKNIGRNHYQVFSPDLDRPLEMRPFVQEGAKRAFDVRPGQSPAEMVLNGGKNGSGAISKALLREANGHLVVATLEAQRMTEAAEQARAQMAYQAKLEAQVMESQRLETLGILAAGVAHDFNNLLTTILGNADLGRIRMNDGGDLTVCFGAIERAATRAADLTRQLLAYAGKGMIWLTQVDLAIEVEEVVRLLAVSIPKNVTIHCDQADRLPFVKGDATQILQVMMNLITNASESFAEGEAGQIIVRTRAEGINEQAAKSGCWALALEPGRYTTVEVADTGAGMTPEVQAQIFEPFFSTKFAGRGLGLAAVFGIIRRHGGGLQVRSEPGHGSSFKVFLPAMKEARLIPNLEPLVSWRGEGRCLIVDEDRAMRNMARHLAEQLGFSVTETPDGLMGIETFRQGHGDLALVLMDLKTARAGGREVLKEMQKIDSRVPVVSSSSYDEQETSEPEEGLAGFIKKPYRVAEFQNLLQRTLAPRNAATA
jgi:diguanylate cyclase (GGDEF)-like protein